MADPIEVLAIDRDSVLRYEDTAWSLSDTFPPEPVPGRNQNVIFIG